MSADKVDRPKAPPSQPARPANAANPSTGRQGPDLGLMVPTNPFGNVLESRSAQDRAADHGGDEKQQDQDRRQSASDRAADERQETEKKRDGHMGSHERVAGLRGGRERQSGGQQDGRGQDRQKGADSLAGHGREVARDHRQELTGGRSKANQVEYIAPQALGAKAALENMQHLEQLTQSAGRKDLPPQILNQIISEVAKFHIDGRESLLVQFRRDLLGGELNLRLTREEDGVTSVTFEGDEKALDVLRSHQSDLEAALARSGRTTRLHLG